MLDFPRFVSVAFAIFSVTNVVSGRAVNISNTWMLPEEGFPVFYRYFRDRISWYEADAVCQFHHGNLVTADTTKQYDAIRAYLKELDITDSVWIGLSKASEKPNFTWSDYRAMSAEGHWQEAIPVGNEPLCVAMDPAADFLWKSLHCGGPEIAAFICELQVPSWAMGLKGCLLTELPSLTVLYIPEQAALELTSDCGLDGTKRIACKGNADREEILKQLRCAISNEDFDDKSTKSPIASSTASEASSDENSLNSKTTKPWIWTSNTIETDYGMPTRHRRETEDTLSPISTSSTGDLTTKSMDKKKIAATIETLTVSNSAHYDTQVTSFSSESDRATMDSGLSQTSDKSSELTATQAVDITTQDSNTKPEEQGEVVDMASVTALAKTASDSAAEDTAEYPSAINQGQLFSIIENGTMFDIIELNETGTEEAKKPKDSSLGNKQITETPKLTTPAPSTTTNPTKHQYTTIIYNKEPTSVDATYATNKVLKKPTRTPKKQLIKESDPKKSNYLTDKEKQLHKPKSNELNSSEPQRIGNEFETVNTNKEVNLFPQVVKNSDVKLNRTYRKELPVSISSSNENIEQEHLETGSSFGLPKVLNFSISNDLNNGQNVQQHVEIKIHEEGKKNVTKSSFIVTTKRADKTVKNVDESTTTTQATSVPVAPLSKDIKNVETLIDPKLNRLNFNATVNNESETFIPMKQKRVDLHQRESKTVKKASVQKPPYMEDVEVPNVTHSTVEVNNSSEPVEPQADEQPRPNRKRQLTQPQRRSFYPYFFSRVLG